MELKRKSSVYKPQYRKQVYPYVDVPLAVSEGFRKRGYVPVKGTLNYTLIRTTLVPTEMNITSYASTQRCAKRLSWT